MPRIKLVWRAIVLLALIALTVSSIIRATMYSVQHSELAQQVAVLEAEHEKQKLQYTGSLVERQRLQSDPEEQVKLLKEKMGYARKNEIPIVVSIEQEDQ
jgi:hypothetical protein